MLRVTIYRRHGFATSIGGDLFVNGAFVCHTLELGWLWNLKNKSCVPPGVYSGFVRYDKKDKWRIQITGIPGNRQGVQIHIGNRPNQIEGCVLVGTRYSPDTIWDSAGAYRKFKAACASYHRGEPITVEFKGILITPWGDYPSSPRVSTIA